MCDGVNETPVVNLAYYTATNSYGGVKLGTEMRAAPTIAVADQTDFTVYSNNGARVTTDVAAGCTFSTKHIELVAITAAATGGHSAFMRTKGTDSSITLDAEL